MVYTSYFAKHKKNPDPNAVYLSIAVGNPKYSVPYTIVDFRMLKPFGVFGVYDGEEYKKKYFERLDSYGVDKIREEMLKLSGDHEKVFLLCHEKNKNECHRSMFAEWWEKHTGEVISEWDEKVEESKEEKYEQLSFI